MSALRVRSRVLALTCMSSLLLFRSSALGAAAPANGTYGGTTQQGGPVSLVVANREVTEASLTWQCGGNSTEGQLLNRHCTVSASGDFTCGSTGSCPSMLFSGKFTGSGVTGTVKATDFSCCVVNLTWTAALLSVPAAPTNLTATALSTSELRLQWKDNASNESEFRIQEKGPGGFEDIDTAAANATELTIDGLEPATAHTFRVSAHNAAGDSAFSNEATATTFTTPQPCVAGDTALCLNGGRFKVEAAWRTAQGSTGNGHVVALTGDTGYFWFFNSANVEMIVKVLNGCGLNSRYWVFAGGLTDVQVDIRLTDSRTGAIKTYSNAQGAAFQPIQDTAAFATCP